MDLPFHWIEASFVGILGLLIGSFLNVVVHRLPKMMEQQWAEECAEMSGTAPAAATAPFNLMVPRSRCPACGHQITWVENIPLLSYLFLRGRCSACKVGISARYPLVELATGLLFFLCASRWGITLSTGVWCVFCATVVCLALIDWDTTLLPDDLTLPLLWLGLIAAALGWTPTNLQSALWGVVAGYLSLWTVYWCFKLVTGKEGMGYGDFKLFAALGAWFGWQALIPIILMASVIGAIVGIAMKFSAGLRDGGYVPFGPFLAGSGLTVLFVGPAALMRIIGL
jgi:leader peptidase (prepilin peptidase)/N-methyltransferase